MTDTLAAFNQTRQAKGLPLVDEVTYERLIDQAAFNTALKMCRYILGKLSLISEGATAATPANMQVVTTGGPWECGHCNMRNPARTRRCAYCAHTRSVADKGVKQQRYKDSTVPKGVRTTDDLTNGNGHAPSKNHSLWAHYSFRIARAVEQKDTGQLLKLAGCATRDYETHYRLRPTYHENHEAAVTELLRDCRGVSALEAAWQLGAPLKWVKRHRVLNGYDGELGEPRRNNPLTQRIVDLKAAGATVKIIANECGVSTGYVSNVLNGKAGG